MKRIGVSIILIGSHAGRAGAPVRPALQENLGTPPGIFKGNRFTGIRYPFHVSVPWRSGRRSPPH